MTQQKVGTATVNFVQYMSTNMIHIVPLITGSWSFWYQK